MVLLNSWAHACDLEIADNRVAVAEPALVFAAGGRELVPEAGVTLDGLACLLREDPSHTLQIEAHTDARGASSYNLAVSQTRADAVRAALLERGADSARVTAVGYGELYPLASNAAVVGRGTNRRIELHTAPPSDRPPRPDAPEVSPPAPLSPRPAPVAVDVCAQARTLRPDAIPSWPGAACSATDTRWRCVVPGSFDALAKALGDCFDTQRDGDELWLTVHATSMRLRPVAGGTELTPR